MLNAIIIQIVYLIVSIKNKFSMHFDFRAPHVIHSVVRPLLHWYSTIEQMISVLKRKR